MGFSFCISLRSFKPLGKVRGESCFRIEEKASSQQEYVRCQRKWPLDWETVCECSAKCPVLGLVQKQL